MWSSIPTTKALSTLLLSKTQLGEELFLYIIVSLMAISVVMIREYGRQKPVYYVRKTHLNDETRYSHLEKAILTLVSASQKLCPYFKTHTITVIICYPIKTILSRVKLFKRVTKYVVELGEYDIRYQPSMAKKWQGLVDFLTEFAPESQDHATKEVGYLEDTYKPKWELFVDGASNARGHEWEWCS